MLCSLHYTTTILLTDRNQKPKYDNHFRKHKLVKRRLLLLGLQRVSTRCKGACPDVEEEGSLQIRFHVESNASAMAHGRLCAIHQSRGMPNPTNRSHLVLRLRLLSSSSVGETYARRRTLRMRGDQVCITSNPPYYGSSFAMSQVPLRDGTLQLYLE